MRILYALIFLQIISCGKKPSEEHHPLTIIIQPFADVSDEETRKVAEKLKELYPHIMVKEKISLPAGAYYAPRKRYRADSLIAYLSRLTGRGNVTIELTCSDISTTKNGIEDWGVMGLGFQPGNACIVSDFRLAKNKKLAQLPKVAIHELGHTQGLPHCNEKSCFMRDAEGGNHTDEEVAFCIKCKKVMINKGWEFE